VNEATTREKHQEQHAQAVDVVIATEQVVLEAAEQRRRCDAVEAIEAAGPGFKHVREFHQHDADRERQHQQREAVVAQQQEA
jgi:hypothetical protein